MKPFRIALLLALGCSAAALAASPQDFRAGIELLPEDGRPVAELSLPDAVYQGVTRADLGDLGVFNAQGTPVPFALCAAPPRPAVQPADVVLPVFPLRTAKAAAAAASVKVESGGAVNVEVQPAAPAVSAGEGGGATEVGAYVIDARAAAGTLGAIRIRWRSADGASELHVRVEDSDDLDQWQTLVPQATLVQAGTGGQTLQRERIVLPVGNRAYLRITRNDAGPAPWLDEVLGELRPTAAQGPAALWFEAVRQPPDAAHGFPFDAARLAPVASAHITLPSPNMTLQLALQSRPRADGSWRTVWSGTVYSVGAGPDERHSEDPRFAADSDRYWRIQVLQGADSLGGAVPDLRLGFEPARLRFLVQGDGPFLLAYGSGRAPITPSPGCDGLLRGLPQVELQSMIGAVRLGAGRSLGGAAALQPPPRPTPLRQMLLWAILLAGAAAVAWMAMTLIRSLRR